jgi:uncharacterized protein
VNVEPVSITVSETVRVSGLLQNPPHARACYVMAHGAGAGMNHAFMAALAAGLARRGIASLRFQFPYMERGAKLPDPPQLAQATVRAATSSALVLVPERPLIGGGKSFGGRMTSQAQAKAPLQGVRADWRSLDFPCIPPVIHRKIALCIYSMCKSRCCSCRAPTINWRPSIKLSRFAASSESWQR